MTEEAIYLKGSTMYGYLSTTLRTWYMVYLFSREMMDRRTTGTNAALHRHTLCTLFKLQGSKTVRVNGSILLEFNCLVIGLFECW